MIKHTIKLHGDAAIGARISARVLALMTDTLLEASRRSLRLRVEGRSNLQSRPAWMDSAVDFDITGISEGSTILSVESPSLGDVAPDIFHQLPLWDYSPRPEQSALELLDETLREAVRGNADSDLLDRNILTSITDINRILDLGFDGLTLGSAQTEGVMVTPDGLRNAERLRNEAPLPRRVIVSGILDQLTVSTRSFKLLLNSASTLRGLLPPVGLASYPSMLGKRVAVDGEAIFRPSGVVSLLVASHIQEATDSDVIWERLPEPISRSVAELRPHNPLPPRASGFARIFGRWPGNETDEEINAALEEIS